MSRQDPLATLIETSIDGLRLPADDARDYPYLRKQGSAWLALDAIESRQHDNWGAPANTRQPATAAAQGWRSGIAGRLDRR